MPVTTALSQSLQERESKNMISVAAATTAVATVANLPMLTRLMKSFTNLYRTQIDSCPGPRTRRPLWCTIPPWRRVLEAGGNQRWKVQSIEMRGEGSVFVRPFILIVTPRVHIYANPNPGFSKVVIDM
jgi:hypothetical protein